MIETDWQGLSDARFEKNATILELVESLAMESLSLKEHKELRAEYCYRHTVSDRTIRNYIARYRKGGAQAFLVPIVREPSPRVHDQELAGAILELVKERPTRTVPKLRQLLAVDTRFTQKIGNVSDRSIYRFLLEHGLSQKTRHALLNEDGRMSFHRFRSTRRTARRKPTFSSGLTTTPARSCRAGTTSTKSFPAWKIPSSVLCSAGAYP